MAQELANKVAVVTGAASGIANAFTKKLLAQGHKVFAVDRNKPLLDELSHPNVTNIVADIGTAAGQAKIKNAVGNTPVYLVAHIAAVHTLQPLMEQDLKTHNDIMRSNVNAPIFLTQAHLPNIKAANQNCRIIFVAFKPLDSYAYIPTFGSTCCSKAGVKYIFKYMSEELKDVAKSAYVCFGPTKTPFWLHPKTGALAKFPNSPFAKKVKKAFDSGNCHTADQASQWLLAVYKQNDNVFQNEHFIDNPEHNYNNVDVATTQAYNDALAEGKKPKLGTLDFQSAPKNNN
jgi:short-subunit dehydrogenase